MSIAFHHDEVQDPSIGQSGTARAAMPSVLIAIGLSFVLYLALFAFAYADTIGHMVALWGSAPMFHYGFFVLPASLLIGYCLRSRLQAFRPGPYIPALFGICLFGAFWFTARLFAVQTFEYFALIGLLVSGIIALIGPGFGRAMIFPLGFLFAMVPIDFGPSMQLPGLEFLAAQMVLAILLAWLLFKTWWKREVLVIGSFVLPIITHLVILTFFSQSDFLLQSFYALPYGWLISLLTSIFIIGVAGYFSDRTPMDILKEDFNPRPPSHWTNRHLAASLILLALPALLVAIVEG